MQGFGGLAWDWGQEPSAVPVQRVSLFLCLSFFICKTKAENYLTLTHGPGFGFFLKHKIPFLHILWKSNCRQRSVPLKKILWGHVYGSSLEKGGEMLGCHLHSFLTTTGSELLLRCDFPGSEGSRKSPLPSCWFEAVFMGLPFFPWRGKRQRGRALCLLGRGELLEEARIKMHLKFWALLP